MKMTMPYRNSFPFYFRLSLGFRADPFRPLKRSPSERALDGSYRSQSTVTDTPLYNFSDYTSTVHRPSAVRRHTTSAVPLATTTYQPVGQSVTTLPGFPGDAVMRFAMSDTHNSEQMWEGFCQYVQSLVDCAYRHDFVSIENQVGHITSCRIA